MTRRIVLHQIPVRLTFLWSHSFLTANAADLEDGVGEERRIKDEGEEEAEATEHEVTNRREAIDREEAKLMEMIKGCVTCTTISPIYKHKSY